ncbi:MAG: PAS domain S-box protein [Phycisphaerales bacterium]
MEPAPQPGPRDLSERLRESEARRAAILESALDAVITMDSAGRVIDFNPGAERTLGYTREQAVGRTVAELMIPPGLRESHRAGLARYLATGEGPVLGRRIEVPAMRADGSEFPAELAIAVSRLPDGSPLFTAFLRDISERKRAERELRRHAAALMESNADLEDFAYIAGHDLKEPLRGISASAAFLLEDAGGTLNESTRSRVNAITRLSARMYGLLDSLLEYSRVGRAELAFEMTDLNAVVAGALETLQACLSGARVAVLGPLPTVRCDAVRVGQVFSNLIANAVKYNDRAEKRVEIGREERSGELVLFVRDNGIGIRRQHTESIFKMFRRLHPREGYGGGTGAGLTIVKRIVERHGGRVWLESVPGEGTTFYFTLAPSPALSVPLGMDSGAVAEPP